jgi:hypothetical protein
MLCFGGSCLGITHHPSKERYINLPKKIKKFHRRLKCLASLILLLSILIFIFLCVDGMVKELMTDQEGIEGTGISFWFRS